MRQSASHVLSALKSTADPEKAVFYPRFFKTGKGEYGEGDRFLGVTVQKQRKIAKQFHDLPEPDIIALLESPYHECRLTGLFVLTSQFERADESRRKQIVALYLANIEHINNWDLVDATAHKILGVYLANRDRSLLKELSEKDHLWSQRISIIATLHFIKLDDYHETLSLARTFLDHPHDLMHKAVGWMLREIGNRDRETEERFLRAHYREMPRTMLRYAIEKLPQTRRKKYLAAKS